jgi:tRNA(Met) C34 N-acetyltransferase TmcA
VIQAECVPDLVGRGLAQSLEVAVVSLEHEYDGVVQNRAVVGGDAARGRGKSQRLGAVADERANVRAAGGSRIGDGDG